MVSPWTRKLDELNASQHNGILDFEGFDQCTPIVIQVPYLRRVYCHIGMFKFWQTIGICMNGCPLLTVK